MTRKQEIARDRATRTLVHYIRTAFVGAGLKWDRDNDVEVAGIVDDIWVSLTDNK